MQIQRSEQQRRIFDLFAEAGRSVAKAAPEHDAERQFDFQSWEQVTDKGLWRLAVPRDRGGFGGDWSDFVVALEGLSSTAQDLGFLISVLGHIGALRVLLDFGTEEQITRWLDQLMQGRVGITAMTERTGGSDLARMSLSASRHGDGWLLAGEKVHITNAPIASLGMIAGRIPELGAKKDITLFFIDLPSEHIRLGELEDNLGIRTSPTCDLIFDNQPLSQINIIGAAGDGLRVLHQIIAFERALYGAISAGMIGGMVDMALARVESRHAFGHPLADYQYVQGRIAEMKVAALTCRLLGNAAIQQLDERSEDASMTCSAAKLLAGEHLHRAAEHLVQLHGHLGFMNNEISRQMRDAVGMRIAGGTSDIQKINIFNQLRRRAAKNVVQRDGQSSAA